MTQIKTPTPPAGRVKTARKGMAVFNAHHRKLVTSVALGCWLFAFFVAVAHACGLGGDSGHSQRAVATPIDGQCQSDGDAHPSCEQYCADNLPVLAKQSVQDQPGGQAPLPPFVAEPLLAPIASVPSLHRPHPPPGIALNTRFVRLAL